MQLVGELRIVLSVPVLAGIRPVPLAGRINRCRRWAAPVPRVVMRAMVLVNHEPEITSGVVGSVFINVVDDKPVRDESLIVCLPNNPMQANANVPTALKILAAKVVPKSLELLNGRRDDGRVHCLSLWMLCDTAL